MESKPSINVSRKRPFTAVDSVQIPKFGAPISHRVPVISVTGCPPPLTAAARGSSQAEAGGVQPSVPDAAALGPEVPQVNEDHLAEMQNDTSNVISQPHPEETPVEPPPMRNSDLGLKPAIMERINSYASISVSRDVPKVPTELTVDINPPQPIVPNDTNPPPLQGLEQMRSIVNKYSHLWS